MKNLKNIMILSFIVVTSITYTCEKDQDMIRAVRVGDIRSVDRLLDEGVNPNLQESAGGHSLLQMTIQQKDNEKTVDAVAIVNALLARGANPNLQSNAGNTPLMYAIKYAQKLGYHSATSIVRLLLENDPAAQQNIVNNKNETVQARLDELRAKDSRIAEKIENLLRENQNN